MPRFLQKGFASRVNGNQVYTWVYRKGVRGLEANTVNIGKTRDFYGRPGEPNADETITKFETAYASLLDVLRKEPDGARARSGKVPELIAHLSRRSSSLRASLVDVTQTVLRGVLPQAEAEIERRVAAEIEKQRQELLRATREKLKAAGHDPRLAPQIVARFEPQIALLTVRARTEVLDPMLQIAGDAIKQTVPKTIRESHNAALAKLDSMHKLTELYGARYSWSVRVSEAPLILGDTACIFEVAGGRRYAPVDDGARRVFLPISRDRAVVGLANNEQLGELDGVALNEAAASCASKFFISAKELQEDSLLPRLIGTKSGILTDDDVDRVIGGIGSKRERG